MEGKDDSRVVETYRRSSYHKVAFIVSCAMLMVVSIVAAIGLGPVKIDFIESIQTLISHMVGEISDPLNDYFIWGGRFPRALMGVLTGAGLAIGGCVMQSILHNNLADSYTTGISAGAGFGATIAFIAGITLTTGAYAVVLNAFVFSLIPTFIILIISKMKGGSPLVMVMSGIALMYMFNAISAILKIMADPNDLAALLYGTFEYEDAVEQLEYFLKNFTPSKTQSSEGYLYSSEQLFS